MNQTTRVTGNSTQYTDVNRAQVAIGENSYQKRNTVNDAGQEETLVKGTVMGVINTGANAGKAKAFDSTSIDGSEIPRFVLNRELTLADDGEQVASMIIDGDVYAGLLVFVGADTLDGNIDGVGTPRDLLQANSCGIRCVPVEDGTGFDN